MEDVKTYEQVFVWKSGCYNLFPNDTIRKELNTNGFLVIRVVSNVSPLTALNNLQWFSQQSEGRTEGLIILVSAPVSINPMTGTSLWNFEGRIDILREGLGMVETWLTFWTVEMTKISSESEDSARMKAVWSFCSDCSEKLDSTSSFSDNNEECWRCCMRQTTLADLWGHFEQSDSVSYRWNNGYSSFFYIGKHFFSWNTGKAFWRTSFCGSVSESVFFFLVGQAFLLIFAFNLEIGFLQSSEKGFLSAMRSLKNSFCSQIFSRHNIAVWKIFSREMSAMLRFVAVSYLWRSSWSSKGSEAMKTCLRDGSLKPFSL